MAYLSGWNDAHNKFFDVMDTIGERLQMQPNDLKQALELPVETVVFEFCEASNDLLSSRLRFVFPDSAPVKSAYIYMKRKPFTGQPLPLLGNGTLWPAVAVIVLRGQPHLRSGILGGFLFAAISNYTLRQFLDCIMGTGLAALRGDDMRTDLTNFAYTQEGDQWRGNRDWM